MMKHLRPGAEKEEEKAEEGSSYLPFEVIVADTDPMSREKGEIGEKTGKVRAKLSRKKNVHTVGLRT